MAKNETHNASASVSEGNGAKDEENIPLEVSDNAVNVSPSKSVGFNLDTDVADENTVDDIDAEIDDALDEG